MVATWDSSLRKPNSLTWRLQPNTQTFTSPLTRSTQSAELVGSRWRVDMSWQGLKEVQWRPFSAFIAGLRGASGRVLVWPFHAWRPQGTGLGSPKVNGASQTGASLITDGWTDGVVLKKGDFFSFVSAVGGYELKQAMTDVTAVGGEATITFEPPIRNSPADNADLTVTYPVCKMMLQDDDQGAFDIDNDRFGTLNLSLVEAFT